MSFQQIDNDNNQRPEGKTCILVYGYNQEGLKILEDYARNIGINKVIEITPDKTHYTLEEIINEKKNGDPKISGHNEKAIVLNAISDYELNQFVHNFSGTGLPRPLFAVVTEISVTWKFHDLINDLLEEKAMFEKMHKEKKNKK